MKLYDEIQKRLNQFDYDFGSNLWLMNRVDNITSPPDYDTIYHKFSKNTLKYLFKYYSPNILNNDIFLIYAANGKLDEVHYICLAHIKAPHGQTMFYHHDIYDYDVIVGEQNTIKYKEYKKREILNDVINKL